MAWIENYTKNGVLGRWENVEHIFIPYSNGLPSDILRKSDVIDNLNSNETDKPLSAKQGNVLDNRISTEVGIVNNRVDTLLYRIRFGGRWILSKSRNWMSNNTIWRTNYYYFNQSYGGNTEPLLSRNAVGYFFKKQTKLKNIIFYGNVNSNSVKGVEYFIAFESGDYDNDGVSSSADITRDVLKHETIPFPNKNIIKKVKFDLGDYIAPNDGRLVIYIRTSSDTPTGTTYYYYVDGIIEYESIDS